ncbi:MAG TPA: O-antigen ligase family protein, partial [Pyrinomonadaceae bacterium]|nr:O-antigen ligase family protein [Pyrinomonadaceae bacterium]
MQTMLGRLDELAGIESDAGVVAWLERVAFVFLILMVISAPHSIAATQTAWITGMFVWIIRLFFQPRVKFRFGLLDAALWGFFLWSVITSLTSYAPDISVNKLRGAAVFLIFYFVLYNLRTRRAIHTVAFTLIVSCMVNVLWTPVQRLIGRGVEIHGLAPNSPLAKAILGEGDALLEANGRKLYAPDDVVVAIEQQEVTKLKFYRPDFEYVVEIKRADLLDGSTALEKLGISSWKKSRNWRSSGFYGHYTTYSEVLQLIASLVLGLLVASVRRNRDKRQETRDRRREHSSASRLPSPFLPLSLSHLLLLFSLLMMSLALLLTVTRASQLAFLIAGAVIVLVGLGRKWLVGAIAVAVPLAGIGLFFLQQSRQVGFFDPTDDSTRWRQTVWREGVDLWTDSPRHF